MNKKWRYIIPIGIIVLFVLFYNSFGKGIKLTGSSEHWTANFSAHVMDERLQVNDLELSYRKDDLPIMIESIDAQLSGQLDLHKQITYPSAYKYDKKIYTISFSPSIEKNPLLDNLKNMFENPSVTINWSDKNGKSYSERIQLQTQ